MPDIVFAAKKKKSHHIKITSKNGTTPSSLLNIPEYMNMQMFHFASGTAGRKISPSLLSPFSVRALVSTHVEQSEMSKLRLVGQSL